MRLTRLFVDAKLDSGTTMELPVEPAAHLVKVLRARSGDEMLLFNGEGRDFSAVIGSVNGKRVSAEVGAAHAVESESTPGHHARAMPAARREDGFDHPEGH